MSAKQPAPDNEPQREPFCFLPESILDYPPYQQALMHLTSLEEVSARIADEADPVYEWTQQAITSAWNALGAVVDAYTTAKIVQALASGPDRRRDQGTR